MQFEVNLFRGHTPDASQWSMPPPPLHTYYFSNVTDLLQFVATDGSSPRKRDQIQTTEFDRALLINDCRWVAKGI